MNFSFGNKSPATGFTLPTNPPTTTTTTTPSGLLFNSGSGDNKLLSKPSLFAIPTSSTTSQPSTLKFGQTTTTPAVSSAATTASVTATTTAQLTFASAKAPASTASFTPILGSTTSTSTGITIGTPTTTSASASKLFGTPSTTPATSTPVLALAATSTVAATTVTSTTSTIPTTASLTFAQLEDSINKWTIDLEEQGKFFLNQAKQLNAWDSLLISNGEKILNLNGSIERVKHQQQQLDQELDFVLAQQRELEELLAPLEKDLIELPVTDIDRNQMYQFSEIIDSQLKQMSDDLKEIIEHINESNKDESITNPVTQIGRILNAHMNSLQWIDRNTAQISAHLEQITKLQDCNRRNFGLNQSLNH